MSDRRKDSPPLWVRRQATSLVPVTAYDLSRIENLPVNVNLRADFRRDRSPVHHRFYWALLGIVASATGVFAGNSEMLHRWLKLRMGLIQEIEFFDGTTVMDLTSTSWQSMDQIEFRAYFDGAVQLILTEVLPGARRAALIAEAEQMLGVRERGIWKEAA